MSLLRCGHLGDSEFNECTVVYCTEPPYKSAGAPSSQTGVALATLKQKNPLFLPFYTKKVQVCDFAGFWHEGDTEFQECTVLYCTETPYKSAEAPRSQNAVAQATLKQKKAPFLLFHTKKVQVCDVAGLLAPGPLRG